MLTNYQEDPNDPKTLFLSRLWLHRHCAADSAHRFLLSADCLLLRQLFSEAPRLVHRHEEVPEAPGILRPEKGHDSKGQSQHPHLRDLPDGLGFFFMARKAL